MNSKENDMEEKEMKDDVQNNVQSGQEDQHKKTPFHKKDSLKALKTKVSELEEQLKSEKDSYLLLAADFENFRRRSAADRLDLINTASEKIILELLPVLDDCERALKALGESDDSKAAKEGTELIYNKLIKILNGRGLKEIEAAGKKFDTDFMEATAQFPVQDDSKKGQVFDVIQKGYILGEKVIRYAKVVVGV